jgi:hypothetical protein
MITRLQQGFSDWLYRGLTLGTDEIQPGTGKVPCRPHTGSITFTLYATDPADSRRRVQNVWFGTRPRRWAGSSAPRRSWRPGKAPARKVKYPFPPEWREKDACGPRPSRGRERCRQLGRG